MWWEIDAINCEKGKGAMKFVDISKFNVGLTDHAYERYLERVGPIDRKELEQWCNDQLAKGLRYKSKKGIIHFGATWWGCEVSPGHIALTTCYGKGNIDLVRGIWWAERNNDRINLKALV